MREENDTVENPTATPGFPNLASAANMPRRISLGRDVYYQANADTTYVAKVTAVDPETGRVTLAIFQPGESHLWSVANVREGTDSGTWRWPTLI